MLTLKQIYANSFNNIIVSTTFKLSPPKYGNLKIASYVEVLFLNYMLPCSETPCSYLPLLVNICFNYHNILTRFSNSLNNGIFTFWVRDFLISFRYHVRHLLKKKNKNTQT